MRTGIALGSNLGESLALLKQARDMILPFHRGDVSSFLVSPAYRTSPVDCPEGSPDFLNAVIEMEWGKSKESLWELAWSIEHFFGRKENPVRNAPRPMDVDILYMGDEISGSGNIVLPHPRMSERLFVLKPLFDIVPERVVPGLGETVASLLKKVSTEQDSLVLVARDW